VMQSLRLMKLKWIRKDSRAANNLAANSSGLGQVDDECTAKL